VALSIVRRNDPRILAMRPSPRDGLYALASAWHASNDANVRPFGRPAAPPAGDTSEGSDATAEPPYWPDGPSAA
jgi:hypothetical protein